MSSDLQGFLSAVSAIIGSEYVYSSETDLHSYNTTTFATTSKSPAVIKPASSEEVQACMKAANEYLVTIYPISTGRNVGYGSKVASADNTVIMDLGRINKIIDFNEELAYVTVEPGVTQQQLFDFIKDKNCNLWLDVTGSYADHSLIGNLAERGFGHTPYGDHFANVSGFEIVLPTGELMKTGFGRFENAKSAEIYKWGVGPYVDGLFTQSNLGIITKATIWLMPAPDYFQTFYFSVEHHHELEKVIDLLQPLRLDGTISSAMHIGNDYKVLSSIMRYPWKEANGKTPLAKTVLDDFAKSWDFGAWNASGALYGTRKEIASARKKIKKQLKGKVNKLRFLDDTLLKLADIFQKPYMWITKLNLPELLKILKPVYGMTKGVPTDDMIASTYWRMKEDVKDGMEPDTENCGLMWIAPIAPTSGKNAMIIWKICEEVFAKYDFEPSISITLLTERALDSVIAIGYDRTIEGEDERAMACHDALLDKFTEVGFYPYRLGIQSISKLDKDNPYHEFLRQIKQKVDPNNVLAPGRYI